MPQKPKSQDKNKDARNTSLQLSDANDAVIACAVATKLLTRKGDEFARITNTDVFKVVTILKKQSATKRSDPSKPVLIDLSASKDKQIHVRLSSETLAAIAYFTKNSLSPLTQTVSKCVGFVNSSACERVLACVHNDAGAEI